LHTPTDALLLTKIVFSNVSVCEVLDFGSDDVEAKGLMFVTTYFLD